ncbi:MAG TPA: dipeptide epimerase, partial [Allosphingosinicella sp.]
MPRTLHAQHHRFPLTRPFRIARGVKSFADVVTVTVSEGGFEGRGEGVPYPRYGESVESALAEIESARAAVEAGAGREALQALLTPGAARNAVDCALWDLEARRSGRDVAALLGLPPAGPLVSA